MPHNTLSSAPLSDEPPSHRINPSIFNQSHLLPLSSVSFCNPIHMWAIFPSVLWSLMNQQINIDKWRSLLAFSHYLIGDHITYPPYSTSSPPRHVIFFAIISQTACLWNWREADTSSCEPCHRCSLAILAILAQHIIFYWSRMLDTSSYESFLHCCLTIVAWHVSL
jgi:hypothetical protein